ncbi:rumi [Carabus blaptoides fortunei]
MCVRIVKTDSAVLSAGNQCSSDHKENCDNREENIYSKETNNKYSKLLDTIESAVKSYSPCDSSNCTCYSSVITKDLKPFKQNGITQSMINAVRTRGTKYQIINGRLYRDTDCLFPSRCAGIEHFLHKLAPKLPNLDLIINTRDYPQIHKSYTPGPVLSFSKTKEYNDIMYPAWSFWEGGPAISLYPRGLGRWDLHRSSLTKASEKYPWNKKDNKAFFRGSRTSSERDPLVLLSRENPDLVDAQYTKNQAWKSDTDTLHAPPASEVSLEEHCKYKYLFNFRGVAASFRLKHLFLCKSLVFHVGNEWLEFFYSALKPWVHYIPVDMKASKEEIKHLIEFAKENDQIVKEIAHRGFETIWENLKMKDISCYWNKLLRKYAKLLKYEPVLDENLVEITKKD